MHEQMTRLYLAAKTLRDIEGPTAIAKLMNASPQTVHNWEERGISSDGLLSAQQWIGCDAIWLRDGTGEMLPSPIAETDRIIELLTLFQQATDSGKEMILDLARATAKRGAAHWTRSGRH